MGGIVFDTSLYVAALRGGNLELISRRTFPPHTPLWLSVVVLEELYAGCRPEYRRVVERLERDFAGVNRIVVPNLADWTRTGIVLHGIGDKYGYEQIRRGRLTNDAFIAMTVARLGLTLLTANERDFARLAEFRRFDWKVARI